MAVRYLTSRRRDGPASVVAALCTCGVFVGVFALVVALALISGFQSEVRTRLLASNPHVVVRGAPGRPAYDEREVRRLSALARAEGAIAVAPFASELGILRSELVPSGAFVQLKGVDPEAEDRVTGLAAQATTLGWAALLEDARRTRAPVGGEAPSEDDSQPLDDDELRPPVLPVVLLGDGLASDLGVAPGDVVHLVSSGEMSAFGPVLKSRALRVAGLVHTGLHEYDHMQAIAALGRLEVVQGGGVEGIEMSLADPQQSSAAAERIAAKLGGDHVVSDWTTTFARLFAAMRFEKIVLFIAIGLIGLVAGFNIFTILTLNVTARTADIGVLAALGATSGAITRIFTWMGLLIGGVGTAGGLVAGALGATWLDRRHLIALDPAVYLVSQISFRVVPRDLEIVAGSMLLVSLLATWLPARAAARLDPVVALRSA